MNRREFLQLTAAASTLAAVSTAQASIPDPQPAPASTPKARRPKNSSPEWHLASISQLRSALDSKRVTSVELTRIFLDRIQRIDRSGPTLRSVIELNPDALALAKAADAERRHGAPRSLLHGIPILLKDNIDTADRMSTTAGSLALLGSTPARDAALVTALRNAGALILGKTNLSEWANFRSSKSTSGWSARGGQTLNPYRLNHNPSGSSSGSAVAVAANLCPLAVGTETDGSILSPASFNGVVGIKPTLGLISRSGIIPIAHSQDTAGPMARSVADAAALLTILSAIDASDPSAPLPIPSAPIDFAQALVPNGLKGARLGVARQFFGRHPRVDALMEAALRTLRDRGAVLIDPVTLPTQRQFGRTEFTVLLYEFKADLNRYLASRPKPGLKVHDLQELIDFNQAHAHEEMPYFGQETLIRSQASGPLTDPAYLEALANNHRITRTEGIDAVMNQFSLDAIIAPTSGPAHVTDHNYGDHDTGGSTSLAAVSGYPSITVPAGSMDHLPIGLSFFGRAWSEPTLLRLAHDYEQATHHRTSPKFLPK